MSTLTGATRQSTWPPPGRKPTSMPQFRFPPLTPFVGALLGVLVVSFLAITISAEAAQLNLFGVLALRPQPLSVSVLWQVFTYGLAVPPGTPGFRDVLVTGIFTYLMLAPYEVRRGTRATATLVGATLVGAGLGALLLAVPLPLLARPLYGAGALVFGAFGALAAESRDAEVRLFGALPMKGKHVLWLGLGWAGIAFLLNGLDHVGLGADLGGLGAGYAVAWLAMRPRKTGKTAPRPKRRAGPALRVVRGGKADDEDPKRWLN